MQEIRKITRGMAEYPARLREIPDPPACLYVKGRLPENDRPSVAVIGARDCSAYGRSVAMQLGAGLGAAGVQVVSGMARGIDGISQEAALDAGGTSFGVLGCGADICYPAQNRGLYEKLCAEGGVLSEYEPGTPPRAWHFPPRNRIVSGLADAVVVVEARAGSGTLITVDMALEQGREVYAVPGRVTDGLSVGCNRLIRLGAGLLPDMEEFLEELWAVFRRRAGGAAAQPGAPALRKGQPAAAREEPLPQKKPSAAGPAEASPGGWAAGGPAQETLSAESAVILEALDFYPQSAEQIQERLPPGYRGSRLNAGLLRLCMEGAAQQVSPGYFCRNGG